MGYKLPNYAEKLPIDGIDRAIEKEEGLPTRSELFSLILLVPEWPITASQTLPLLYFDS